MTPTVVTDQERHRRVTEEGSKRKRDLAGYRRIEGRCHREWAEALAARLPKVGEPAISDVWADVAGHLRSSLPSSTFSLWIEPLSAFGAEGSTLFLSAPEGIRAWTERRYSGLIREALAGAGAPYSQVEFVGEGEPCR
jgi:hypothetical protein